MVKQCRKIKKIDTIDLNFLLNKMNQIRQNNKENIKLNTSEGNGIKKYIWN